MDENQYANSDIASLEEAVHYDSVEQKDYVNAVLPGSGVQDPNDHDDNVYTTPSLLDTDKQLKDVSPAVAEYHVTDIYEEIPAEFDALDTYVSLENIDQSENEVYQNTTVNNEPGQVSYQTSSNNDHDDKTTESDVYTALGPGEGSTVYQTRDIDQRRPDNSSQDTQEKVTELKNKFSVTKKGIVIVIHIPFSNTRTPLVITVLITLSILLLLLVIGLVVGSSIHYNW